MPKKIMILGGSVLQIPAIEESLRKGLDVLCVDYNPAALAFSVPGVKKFIVSTNDVNNVFNIAKDESIDGIVTLASDMPMRTVAFVSQELGLNSISVETSYKTTDKFLMRESLKKYNVPIPRFCKISSVEELIEFKNDLENFILKPCDNSGSRGVVVGNKYESKAVLEEKFNYSKDNSKNGFVMLEEYMCGPEVSVETFAINGEVHILQVTDKITTGSPHFVEIGHTQPSSLPKTTIEEIKRIAVLANLAVGITNGPSHTEIIVTKEGPKIVEIGSRLGGDCITTHLVPLSTGINMVASLIDYSLGFDVDLEPKFSKGSAIRFFQQKKGIIKNIIGVEDALKINGVKEIFISKKIGDFIDDISNSSSRIGYVIAQGNNALEASMICENVLSVVKIVVD